MNITYYHRYPGPGMYSMERIFNDIRGVLPSGIDFRVHIDRFLSRGFLPRLRNALAAIPRQSDVNHITGDVHYLACFLIKRKTLLTIHDCVGLERLHGLRKWVLFFFWYWLPVKRSALITVVSESTKRELLRYVKCNPDKVRVVHNCVSPAFKPSPRVFNVHRPVILQIGTGQNKNLLRLTEVLSDISCHLRIVGRLELEHIEALVRHRIEYSNLCGISDDDMVQQYRNCDMVVFISTYEGFGMPIVEANATGRPVITSNIFSMSEVAGAAACLVDPFDVASIRGGIMKVIEDAPYRDKLIENGYKNIKRFRPDIIAAHYIDIYKELWTCRDRKIG